MPTPLVFAILTGLTVLVFLSWTIVARPRRALMIVDLLAIALFAWLALSSHRTAQVYDRILAARQEYPVDSSLGTHAIRIGELPDVRGVRVVAYHKDRTTPLSLEDLENGDWRVDGNPAELEDWGIGVKLADLDSDEWGEGRFKKIELSYNVTPGKQAALDRIVLVASAPRLESMAADMLGAIEGILRVVFAIGALVSFAGLLSQLIRGRRRKAA
jgi:hypothetical protein